MINKLIPCFRIYLKSLDELHLIHHHGLNMLFIKLINNILMLNLVNQLHNITLKY